MTQMATITSKRQLTLPANIFEKAGLKIGQKVAVREENGSLIIVPPEKLLEELDGILTMPKKWEGKDLDEIIEESVMEYFKKEG